MNKINLTAILIIIVCSLFMRWDYWASVNEENSSKNFAIDCHSDSIMRIEIIKSNNHDKKSIFFKGDKDNWFIDGKYQKSMLEKSKLTRLIENICNISYQSFLLANQ